MRKRVIEVAADDGRGQPLYFLGFRDRGDSWDCLWTPSRALARWFDADEAETEIRLVMPFVAPQRVVSAQPIAA
jgi:hypothetical protein